MTPAVAAARTAPKPHAPAALAQSVRDGAARRGFFSFVRRDHPFRERIDALRVRLREDGRCAQLRELYRSPQATIHAEIKGVQANGGWRLERIYWCVQDAAACAWLPLRARTLCYAAAADAFEVHEFPRDPCLPTMAAFFEHRRRAFSVHRGQLSLLRYAPLRRLTFLMVEAEERAPLIGKFARRSRFAQDYGRLSAIHRRCSETASGFAVPAPRGVDAENCVYFQQALRGANLAARVDTSNVLQLLARLGDVHRELHSIDVPELPRWRFADYARKAEQEIEWIALFHPELEPTLRRLWQRAQSQLQASIDPARQRFCHGDFVASQVLIGRDRWVVTDFDKSCRGEPDFEVGRVLASLKYDVPLLRRAFESGRPELCEKAEASYLRGYQRAAGERIDLARVRAFRIAAEIHYLAMMLKKAWYRPGLFRRGLRLVESLSEGLTHA